MLTLTKRVTYSYESNATQKECFMERVAYNEGYLAACSAISLELEQEIKKARDPHELELVSLARLQGLTKACIIVYQHAGKRGKDTNAI